MPVEAPPAPSGGVAVVRDGSGGPPAVAPPVSQPPIPSGDTSTPASAPSQSLHNAFGDLDELIKQPSLPKIRPAKRPLQPPPKQKAPPPKPSQKPKPPVEQPPEPSKEPHPLVEKEKPTQIKDEEPVEEQAVKEETESKEEEKPQELPKEPKALREAYNTLKTRSEALERELAQAKADLEAPPPEDTEKKNLSERLTYYEQRMKQLEDELKFAAYERSDEYQEKYDKPYVQAYQSAREKVGRLKITTAEGEQIQAKPEDFDRLMRIQDDDAAAEAAIEMFGAGKAPVVMYHRERVLELLQARFHATNEYRKNGEERFRQEAEQNQAWQKQVSTLWETENKSAMEKYEWFRPKDGDEDGNKLLNEGYQLTDLAFSEKLSSYPIETQVRVHAALRNRAAAFGRVVYWNKQLNQKVAELEKELAEFKETEPKGGEPDTPGRSVPQIQNWEAMLDSMAKER